MRCNKCGSDEKVKNGYAYGRQRWKCKECGYQYTVSQRGKPEPLRWFAVMLYLNGMSYNAISKIIDVTPATVMYWVRDISDRLPDPRGTGEALEVEIDEMSTFLKKDKANLDLESVLPYH